MINRIFDAVNKDPGLALTIALLILVLLIILGILLCTGSFH